MCILKLPPAARMSEGLFCFLALIPHVRVITPTSPASCNPRTLAVPYQLCLVPVDQCFWYEALNAMYYSTRRTAYQPQTCLQFHCSSSLLPNHDQCFSFFGIVKYQDILYLSELLTTILPLALPVLSFSKAFGASS